MKSSEISFARPRSSGLSLLCLGLLAASAPAASIEFVGTESGTAVLNWSNGGVPKNLDLNGDNRFGSAGYYQIMPAAIGTDNVGLPAAPGNDLGITLDISGATSGTLQTAGMTPDFLNGIPSGAAGDYINNTNFPDFTDSTGSELLRQGSLWIAQPEDFVFGFAPGGIEGIRHTAFSFSMKEAAAFRLGVAVDCMADETVAAGFVSVTHAATGEVFSTALTRDGVPDMVFFDIQGDPNDEFVVELWNINEEFLDSRLGFSLITFDQLPIPNLSHVLDGSSLTLSWEPEILGWTLESSTDLGDDWTPVTEPPVVNNSVTLDISDVPKNFFRLRKDP